MKNITRITVSVLFAYFCVSCYGDIMSACTDDTCGPDVDHDGDGYPADEDCNDNDPDIYPGAPEVCEDGIDQDCDGRDDQCPHETICDDGLDNDGDTLIDCRDPDCDDDPACDGECTPGDTRSCGPDTDVGACEYGTQTCRSDGIWGSCIGAVYPVVEVCGNEIDDDCDGVVDEGCGSSEICTDGLDNDGDGRIDCADPDCYGHASCVEDHEVDCADGVDNDHDGATDCDDSDCYGTTECPIPGTEACFRFTYTVPSGQTATSIRIDGTSCAPTWGCIGWYSPLLDSYGNRLEESSSRQLVKTLRFEAGTHFEVNVRAVVLGTEHWYCNYDGRGVPPAEYYGTLQIERSLDCSTGWTTMALFSYDLGTSHPGDCNMRTFEGEL